MVSKVYLRQTDPEDNYLCRYLKAFEIMVEYDESLGTKALSEGCRGRNLPPEKKIALKRYAVIIIYYFVSLTKQLYVQKSQVRMYNVFHLRSM